MASVVVNNAAPFGHISNELVRNVYLVDAYMGRLTGVAATTTVESPAGSQFENAQFGVAPREQAGAAGADWQFALNTMAGAWATFMTAATGALETLDNG